MSLNYNERLCHIALIRLLLQLKLLITRSPLSSSCMLPRKHHSVHFSGPCGAPGVQWGLTYWKKTSPHSWHWWGFSLDGASDAQQGVTSPKAFPTLVTLKGPLPAVHTLMLNQVGPHSKRLSHTRGSCRASPQCGPADAESGAHADCSFSHTRRT